MVLLESVQGEERDLWPLSIQLPPALQVEAPCGCFFLHLKQPHLLYPRSRNKKQPLEGPWDEGWSWRFSCGQLRRSRKEMQTIKGETLQGEDQEGSQTQGSPAESERAQSGQSLGPCKSLGLLTWLGSMMMKANRASLLRGEASRA